MTPVRPVRQTPWGPMSVADAHLHFFSHRFFESLAAQKSGLSLDEIAAKLGTSLPPDQPEALAGAWVRDLDRHGVAMAALIASIPGDETSVTAATRAHPHRFFAYAMVNPRTWDAAQFESIHAACLFPAMTPIRFTRISCGRCSSGHNKIGARYLCIAAC